MAAARKPVVLGRQPSPRKQSESLGQPASPPKPARSPAREQRSQPRSDAGARLSSQGLVVTPPTEDEEAQRSPKGKGRAADQGQAGGNRAPPRSNGFHARPVSRGVAGGAPDPGDDDSDSGKPPGKRNSRDRPSDLPNDADRAKKQKSEEQRYEDHDPGLQHGGAAGQPGVQVRESRSADGGAQKEHDLQAAETWYFNEPNHGGNSWYREYKQQVAKGYWEEVTPLEVLIALGYRIDRFRSANAEWTDPAGVYQLVDDMRQKRADVGQHASGRPQEKGNGRNAKAGRPNNDATQPPLPAKCQSCSASTASGSSTAATAATTPGVQPAPPDVNAKVEIAKSLGIDHGPARDGTWNFRETAGAGGFGHAGLWLKYDSVFNVVDRMTTKETYMSEQEWSWRPNWWSWEPQKRISREAHIHEILSRRCQSSRSIVHIHAAKVYVKRRMHRLYLEYCPLGDLSVLVGEHIRHRGDMDESGNALEYRIPRYAIWAFFEALAMSVCLMERGRLPGEDSRDIWDWENLREIVHRDIKPANVFLTDSNARLWPNTPQVKMGDFGLAIRVNTPDIAKLTGAGTELYMAPEQFDYTQEQCHRIASHTNVYAIGRTIFAAMTLGLENRKPKVLYTDVDGGKTIVPDWLKPEKAYGPTLVHLVERCLEPDPGERIKPKALLDEITRNVQAFSEGYDSLPMKFRGLENPDMLHTKPDVYRLFAK